MCSEALVGFGTYNTTTKKVCLTEKQSYVVDNYVFLWFNTVKVI